MKGILMTPENIKAIIDLRITETRRNEASLKEINQEPDKWKLDTMLDNGIACFLPTKSNNPVDVLFIKPRYHVGEVVYIKEAHCIWCYQQDGVKDACYKTDDEGDELSASLTHCQEPQKWRSPLFLPEWAARHVLKVTAVDAQRLQEITEEDIEAEGTRVWLNNHPEILDFAPFTAHQCFERMWNSINPNHPVINNEWVFRYKFILCDREGK